jgi:hypothetical protein
MSDHYNDALNYLYGGARQGGKHMYHDSMLTEYERRIAQRKENQRSWDNFYGIKPMQDTTALQATPAKPVIVEALGQKYEIDTACVIDNYTPSDGYRFSFRAKKLNPVPELKAGMVVNITGHGGNAYRLLEMIAFNTAWRTWDYEGEKIVIVSPGAITKVKKDNVTLWTKD